MTRKRFERIDVDLNQLMLDKKNARIRHGVDQADCIARILKKEVQVLNLIKDLASKGLSTTSILVSPGEQPETWVVRDGNRRVTAMKLYTRPDLAPTPDLVAKIQAIKRRFPDAEFEPLEVLSSTDEAAIRQEILSRHNGERDGAGLVTWSTYLRTLSLIEAGETAEYRVPALYVTWAEAHSVYVDDDFPLSTLQRFFRSEHLAALGVRVDGDKIQPVSDETKALAMAQRLIGDFQPGAASALTVNDVFTDTQAKAYINRVRSTVGLPPFAAEAPPPNGGGKTAGAGTQGPDKASSPAPNPADGGTEGGGGPDAQAPSPPTGGRARPSPQKDPLDRNKVFGRGSPDLPIPEKETKVRDIVRLMRELDVQKQALAVAMLLRHLIESSEDAYRSKHSLPELNGLAEKVKRTAERLHSKGRLTKDEHDVVIRMCDAKARALVSIETLQKLMHRRSHLPEGRMINSMWEQIAPFIRACWTP